VSRTLLGLLLIALGLLERRSPWASRLPLARARGARGAHRVRPYGPQQFAATLRFPDGKMATYPISVTRSTSTRASSSGTRSRTCSPFTAYELDRVGGRFRGSSSERSAARTLQPVGQEKTLDLFRSAQRHAFLAPSSTRIRLGRIRPGGRAAELELRFRRPASYPPRAASKTVENAY